MGILAQGGSIVCYPKNYCGKVSDFENLIQGPKFPTCSWNTDSYTNWLTQTAVSRSNTKRYAEEDIGYSRMKGAIQLASGLGDMTAGALAEDMDKFGTGVGGLLKSIDTLYTAQRTYDRTIDSLEEQRYQHSLVPNSINNGAACPEVLYSNGNYEFKIQLMTITGERAKQIDEYFDRFGYRVNRNANIVQAIKTRSK